VTVGAPNGDFLILPLTPGSPWQAKIAADRYEHWGSLTGYGSPKPYETFLEQAAHSLALPRVLVTTIGTALLGSVNLLANDMPIRPQFTPWMGQLFVAESQRANGTGTKLLEAAISYIRGLGCGQLFLFTSGTLPSYYRKRGWTDVETVSYLGKERTIMRFAIGPQMAGKNSN
jgi:GNAT superfamily N-acetyltransferase